MKIVGQCVVGGGEADRYLDLTLREFKRLCDDVVIATCNATEKEKQLIQSYGFWQYEDNREWGKHQPGIKSSLLKRIHGLKPDWILVLDADETVPTLNRKQLEEITKDRESCYLYVVDLWNDELHYARSMAFWNVRFYKSDPSKGTEFLRKPVHCGNAPPYFYNKSARRSYVPHILLHRGLMLPEDRLRKSQRYQLYDPHAIHKGKEYYEALLSEETKKEYKEEEVMQQIQAFCAKNKVIL